MKNCLRLGIAMASLVAALAIGTVASDSHAEVKGGQPTFSGCGQFTEDPRGCTTFLTAAGDTFVVPDDPDVPFGEVVFVHGALTAATCPQLPETLSLVDITVQPCSEDIFFTGCGYIGFGPQGCLVFNADLTGESYLLENDGGFTVGDVVFVDGVVEFDLFSCFPVLLPKVVSNTIVACDDLPFQACGTLTAVTFCGVALETADGGLYLLNTVGDFTVGDVVAVTGDFEPLCIVVPECQVSACVNVGTIEACGKNYFSGCGELVDVKGCTVFDPDDIDGLFLLAELGDFASGARVLVSGAVTQDARECARVLFDRIENASIEICCPDADLNGDCLVNGADLGILVGEWGVCGPLAPCVSDLNSDGEVNGTDLGILLGQWSR